MAADKKTEPLSTWTALNSAMLEASEQECERLLKLELAGRKRQRFLLRIHSRINKLRAHRERRDLIKKAS